MHLVYLLTGPTLPAVEPLPVELDPTAPPVAPCTSPRTPWSFDSNWLNGLTLPGAEIVWGSFRWAY